MRADAADQFDALEFWHLQIDESELKIVLSDQTPGNSAVLGFNDVVRELLELCGDQRAENRVIVERRPNFRGFPALMPVSFADLAQNYAVRAGGAGRVADTACQSLTLDPRDALRYGHQLWIEPNSGLLLKASLVNRQGQVLESFAFTQVSIGSNFVRQQLIPSAESQLGRVEKVQSSELRAGDVKWAIENLPAGFRVSKVMLRKLANVPSAQDVVHFVISDGLAAVSVFIEASAANKPNEIGQPSGAMSFYSRQIGAHRAIVMGEVPLVTAKLIGDAIERREK